MLAPIAASLSTSRIRRTAAITAMRGVSQGENDAFAVVFIILFDDELRVGDIGLIDP